MAANQRYGHSLVLLPAEGDQRRVIGGRSGSEFAYLPLDSRDDRAGVQAGAVAKQPPQAVVVVEQPVPGTALCYSVGNAEEHVAAPNVAGIAAERRAFQHSEKWL